MEKEKNPFLDIPYLPAFDRMTPAAAREAFDALLPDALAAVERLEASFTPTWEGLVRPLYDCCHPLFLAWGLFSHLKSVVDNDEWRAVEDAFLPRIVAFSQRVSQSRRLYEGCVRLRDADRAAPCLGPVRRRILDKAIRAAEQAGVGLPGDKRERFNALALRLSQCATDFSNHLLDATKAFSLTLSGPGEADGMPPSLKAVTAQAAAGPGRPADPEKGPWKITLDAAVLLPFMRHSRNRAAREKLFRASAARASSGPLDNSPLIEEILRIRREQANLLGFKTYADLNLSTKMARDVPSVDRLIRRLSAAALPAARREMARLLAFARENGFEEDALRPWDTAFWSERLREALYDYSDEALSRYFPFPRVLEGLFRLAERLFGIAIAPADGDAPVWHPDVRFFRVSSAASGAPLAAFYLDPYSRPETKLGGAWMNEIRARDRAPGAGLSLPLAVVVCNQSVPVGGRPPLMRFDEVQTLFHEFGHALQQMLSTVDEPDASGVNGIEWDAVEIASQFMENWCHDRATLRALGRHVDTGAPLPGELFDKIAAAKNHMAASAMMRQLYFAATDMDLHARYPRPGWPDADAVRRDDEQKYSVHPALPGDRFLCSFSHIFAGGYAAGYYSYKWSEVISADAFAAFEEAGLADPAAVRETGRRFRDTFLALGGGTPPADVFRLFRGRDPSIDAILRHAGLPPPPAEK